MRRARFLGSVSAAVLVWTTAWAADTAQELIVNGGFEVGPQVGYGHHKLGPGSKAIEGWRVIRGSVDYAGEDWVASENKHCIDLEGEASFGGVAQTIATVPGQVYTVRFDLAGNTDGEPQIKKMRVLAVPCSSGREPSPEAYGMKADGQSTERWFDINGYSHQNLGWQEHTWQFMATSDSTAIEFVSVRNGEGHRGALLDNVSVTASQQWGVRKRIVPREASDAGSAAASIGGSLRMDALIPVTIRLGVGGSPDVLQISSVKFVMNDGRLQAHVSGKLLSGPKGKWRLVVEVFDEARHILGTDEAAIENSGIILGRAMISDLDVKIDFGPWENKPTPTEFRMSIETAATSGGPARGDVYHSWK